ncbi:hypothetical protein H4CHR_00445 [Variovorax sp. PBS-H4]|uniref:hypothetical protein n=1 Tax=Variovorax sp. PBS-H4 TaxID=434008 RepID=UPI001318009C|nr:hypothetical protein [Variovorax sp. PBS-H4]VTU19739.1 hypothetical protein H4CHR_00445 [Variovorax sp. PBS-H4]
MIFDTRRSERNERNEREVAARALQSRQVDAGIAPDDLERPVAQQPQQQHDPQQLQATQASQVVEQQRQPQQPRMAQPDGADESLAPLFTPEAARDFRASWDAVQIGFVDDPQRAVRQADELVRQMLQNLSQTFSDERAGLDARDAQVADAASTEKLRVALRRYRAFMQRLLSL